MKKIFAIMMTLTLAFSATTQAKSEKSNKPKNTRAVETALAEAGDEHNPESMKVSKLGSVKVESTYYHIFCGTLKKSGYRVIIFDNKPQYIGYYQTEFEPIDYGEGEILLDSGNSDEDGNPLPISLSIPSKGPAKKIRIDGIPTPFVKNKKLEEKAQEETSKNGALANLAEQKIENEETIDYRDWKITKGGRTLTANAIFIKKNGSKISIKDSKRGKTASFSLSSLSLEDRIYLKKIGEL